MDICAYTFVYVTFEALIKNDFVPVYGNIHTRVNLHYECFELRPHLLFSLCLIEKTRLVHYLTFLTLLAFLNRMLARMSHPMTVIQMKRQTYTRRKTERSRNV